mgnify:FL=1
MTAVQKPLIDIYAYVAIIILEIAGGCRLRDRFLRGVVFRVYIEWNILSLQEKLAAAMQK